jgi:hypothetical protein
MVVAAAAAVLAAAPLIGAAARQDRQPPAGPEEQPRATAASSDRVQLFNGRTLEGWTTFLPDKDGKNQANTVWSVRDGVLVCTGSPVGYIATNECYESFELELEWRFDPSKGAGNSGVLLRVQEPDTVWPTSVEAQLHSENAGDIWNIGSFPMTPVTERTDGRRTKKEHPSNEKPLGEWNRYRIVLAGDVLELHVNGLLQNRATGVAAKPGRIALQSEGAHIEFRSIELTPLPSSQKR